MRHEFYFERENGYIAINPKFDKLIVALRTAVEKGEGDLDKEATSYDDIFDAFRLSMKAFYFRPTEQGVRRFANVWSDNADSYTMFRRYP